MRIPVITVRTGSNVSRRARTAARNRAHRRRQDSERNTSCARMHLHPGWRRTTHCRRRGSAAGATSAASTTNPTCSRPDDAAAGRRSNESPCSSGVQASPASSSPATSATARSRRVASAVGEEQWPSRSSIDTSPRTSIQDSRGDSLSQISPTRADRAGVICRRIAEAAEQNYQALGSSPRRPHSRQEPAHELPPLRQAVPRRGPRLGGPRQSREHDAHARVVRPPRRRRRRAHGHPQARASRRARGRRRRPNPADPRTALTAIPAGDLHRLRLPELLTHAAQGEAERNQVALRASAETRNAASLSRDVSEAERLPIALARLDRRKAKLRRHSKPFARFRLEARSRSDRSPLAPANAGWSGRPDRPAERDSPDPDRSARRPVAFLGFPPPEGAAARVQVAIPRRRGPETTPPGRREGPAAAASLSAHLTATTARAGTGATHGVRL